ncbi:MAG TPA: DUF805 domain-containing protein [bacterium]|nr:DUF805 domain-containing protein [bacterium]
MKYCNNCGCEISKDESLCSKCSQNIKSDSIIPPSIPTLRQQQIKGFGWFLLAVKKYAVFSGRSRRKEYMIYSLFTSLFMLIAIILDNVLGINFNESFRGPIYYTYMLTFLIPGVAVNVRRLHDVGRSEWFCLVLLIPIIGAVLFCIVVFTDSEPGNNKYGPNPKEI